MEPWGTLEVTVIYEVQKATVVAEATLTIRKRNNESCYDTASFDQLATVKNDFRDAVFCLVGYTK